MTAGAAKLDGGSDARMTANREEIKYFVPPHRVDALVLDLYRNLSPHRFVGEGANHLPDPHNFITTIYFDTRSHAHYHAALASPHENIKVRAKEYYDLHPSLVEVATEPDQIVRYAPWLWLELKRRDGERTMKSRFRIQKQDIPSLLAQPCDDGSGGGIDKTDSRREVLAYCSSLDDPLGASVLVNYRRLSFQDPPGELRVTVDIGLAYYAPPPDLWARRRALVRSSLGRPQATEPNAVVEVKKRGAAPAWLSSTLDRYCTRAVRFSKFVAGSRAVHGHG